jgi:hypothetical protein
MNPEHQLATLTCFGIRPFCALLQTGPFTLIGDSRKHHPNLHTGPVHTSNNVTVYCSPGTALAMSPHQTHIQNP